MIGRHNSVLSCIKVHSSCQEYECHLANLCLMVGVQTLPIEVDDLFIDYIITLINVQK